MYHATKTSAAQTQSKIRENNKITLLTHNLVAFNNKMSDLDSFLLKFYK
jgi:hypothetical protein